MERCEIKVRGLVQGVGFRPFVYRLAADLRLNGSVRNRTGEVLIEVEGEPHRLARFLEALVNRPPPLARIEQVLCRAQAPRGQRQFRIEASGAESDSQTFVPPDIATCQDCLAELRDPTDRRFSYPFLNCTNCGPRLTIISGAPYDRPFTTMAGFAMCAECRAEYADPADRRFHAQPTACPKCGPHLSLYDSGGHVVECEFPLERSLDAVREGKIVALKGVGGFHLVCNAADPLAVSELRRRKHRDEKPLAIMLADVEAVERLCEVQPAERALLESPRSPIVLLRKRPAGFGHDRLQVADAVAPGNPYLGVMLPYSPLHHLLLRGAGSLPLVMTSGNLSDEPIAVDNEEAIERLSGVADLFLTHDRPIHVRCDDSVTRIVAGTEMPLRRSRGYAPQPVRLPHECRQPLLAVGGQFKVTFALAVDQQAFLSHHLGDLDRYDGYRAFVRDIGLYEQLFGIRPRQIAHDLHPDYASTRYARERAAREGLELLPVQHHHAHMASCLAEHGLAGPAIGVSFDGTGYGTDGAVWGGEFLLGDCRQFLRAAHLRYVGMPGGEKAIREPWRMALAHLRDADCRSPALESRLRPAQGRIVTHMLERRVNTPWTSSAGRLFDAVASLAGLRDRASYEGQPAMELEWLATGTSADGAYPFALDDEPVDSAAPRLVIDTRPVVRAVAADVNRGTPPNVIARRFHSSMVEIIAAACGRIRRATGVNTVVLSGGVFMNALLTSETCPRLSEDGFDVFRHRTVPPNDGGLSLGQAAVAAAQGPPLADASVVYERIASCA